MRLPGFLDRHIEERSRDLVGASDARAGALGCGQTRHVAATETDRALAGHDRSADQADQRRFSRAVGADYSGNGAGAQLQIDAIDGNQAALVFDEAFDLEQGRGVHGVHAGTRRAKGSFATRPTTP